MRYRRVPQRIRADRLSEPWSWVTANGNVLRAETGDYRVTETRTGAQWSVAPGALRSGYVEVAPGEYEATGEITADRVVGRANHTVPSLEGSVVAHPGDWIVTAADGSQWVLVDSWFRSRYEEVRAARPDMPTH